MLTSEQRQQLNTIDEYIRYCGMLNIEDAIREEKSLLALKGETLQEPQSGIGALVAELDSISVDVSTIYETLRQRDEAIRSLLLIISDLAPGAMKSSTDSQITDIRNRCNLW